MKKFSFKKLISLIFTLILLAVFAMPAFAENPETAQENSLTVFFSHEDIPIQAAEFSIYKIANINPDGSLALVSPYNTYSVKVDGLDSEELTALSATLAAYISRDKLTANYSALTDINGTAVFENIETGFYLVVGKPVTVGKTKYIPQPFLTSVPAKDENGDTLNDVVAQAKYDLVTDTETPIDKQVVKLWDDEGSKNRPNEVTVELLKDGTVYDTVKLNAKNNWRHTWTNLDPDCVWQLTEQTVAANYTVKIQRDGKVFVVTNTLDDTDEPPTTTDENQPTTTPDENQSTTPTDENHPTTSTDENQPTTNPVGTTSGTDTTKPPRLPLTGQLWWPVPVMLSLGLLLFVAGFIARRHDLGA